MRYLILALLVASSLLNADRVKMASMGCQSMEPFHNIPPEALQDETKLTQYAFANGCRILIPGDKVETIGYDPRNDKTMFIQIIHKESGETLYIRRKNIQVEQPGKKNQFRF